MEIKVKTPTTSSKGRVNYEKLVKDIKKHLSTAGSKKQP